MSTAKETVERLMGLSEQLESIVSKENEILETRRPRELEQFGAKKRKPWDMFTNRRCKP